MLSQSLIILKIAIKTKLNMNNIILFDILTQKKKTGKHEKNNVPI
jgi:hypothetical protein